MVIDNAYELGQIVYLVTDSDQKRRVVTQIRVANNCLTYQLSCGTYDSCHYECEISTEVNVLAKTE
jgi:hypothetical protein